MKRANELLKIAEAARDQAYEKRAAEWARVKDGIMSGVEALFERAAAEGDKGFTLTNTHEWWEEIKEELTDLGYDVKANGLVMWDV